MKKKLNIEKMTYICPLCSQKINGKYRMSKYHELIFSCIKCITKDGDSKFTMKVCTSDGSISRFTYIDEYYQTLHCDNIGVEITVLPKYNILNIDGVFPETFFDSNYNFDKIKADKYIKYRALS